MTSFEGDEPTVEDGETADTAVAESAAESPAEDLDPAVALKKELRERRSLADALPADHHYAVVQPAGLPGVDGQRPPAEPPVPRHRLRTYAND